jgi:CRISPR-associated protein Csx3
MPLPILTIDHSDSGLTVNIEIPGGVTTPVEFSAAVQAIAPQLAGAHVVLLNGRAPVWGYGMLIHAAHPSLAIACFDPRMEGYVVVATHDARYKMGQVIAAETVFQGIDHEEK